MVLRSSSFFLNTVSFLCHFSWCSHFSFIKFVAAKSVKLWFVSSFIFRARRRFRSYKSPVVASAEVFVLFRFFLFFFGGWFSHR